MEIEDGRKDGWMEIEDERDGVTSIERKRGSAEPRLTETGENRETKKRKKTKTNE